MFTELVMHGDCESKMEATISWAWHTAAICRAWHVHKNDKGQWSLTAQIVRADSFKLQQRPLFFNAPRKGGHWCWPVRTVSIGETHLTASLGPMEC
jgi:hypothetical protein